MLHAVTAAMSDAIEGAAWTDLYAAAPPAISRALGLKALRVADAHVFIARSLPVSLFNRAFGLGNTQAVTDSDVDAVLRAFEDNGATHPWIQSGPASSAKELPTWLESRGLRLVPRAWAMMQRENEPAPEIATELTIRPVASEHAMQLAKVLAIAHGMPSALAEWTVVLIGRPGWHGYAAWDGDAIVAGGMLFIDGTRGWLGLGGTIPAYRGRGAQGALMTRRVAHALEAGCEVMSCETGEPVLGERSSSYTNMLRSGFHQIASRKNYERP
jgi:hypothetical protein